MYVCMYIYIYIYISSMYIYIHTYACAAWNPKQPVGTAECANGLVTVIIGTVGITIRVNH